MTKVIFFSFYFHCLFRDVINVPLFLLFCYSFLFIFSLVITFWILMWTYSTFLNDKEMKKYFFLLFLRDSRNFHKYPDYMFYKKFYLLSMWSIEYNNKKSKWFSFVFHDYFLVSLTFWTLEKFLINYGTMEGMFLNDNLYTLMYDINNYNF